VGKKPTRVAIGDKLHDLEGFSVEKRFNQVQKYYEGIITSRICSVDFPWSNKL
jgi:hypothetical protein